MTGPIPAPAPEPALRRRGRGDRHGSFTGRLVALQLTGVLVVLAIAFGVSALLARQEAWRQAEDQAQRMARAIAADPQVRSGVTEETRQPGIEAATLRKGPLQRAATAYQEAADLLFVVITDDDGLRLSHPTVSEIGRHVSTEPQALDGHDHVARERGTLGDSVRAKVPVFDPADGNSVVGEVSVGLSVASVGHDAQAAVLPLLGAGAAALLLAALAGGWLARRLRQATLGLGPEEITQLVRDQQAVLHGVGEGVIGLAPDGTVTVQNAAAQTLLGGENPARWPAPLRRAIADGAPGPLRLDLGERVVVLTRRPVSRGGRDLGAVITLRDLTEVEDLGLRLEGVETMAQALRVQRHEFANRLHALQGLLARGATDQAIAYLRSVTGVAGTGADVENLELVTDTYLSAFLGAKAVQASEAGVRLRVGERSDVTGTVVAAQDVTAVLGNLVDNAIRAAAEDGPGSVEVDVITDGESLHLAVVDSGAGVAADPVTGEVPDVFAEGVSAAVPDAAGHGLGIGLALARRLARQRGGDVWLADPGGVDEDGERVGAVFCARLPQVMSGTTKDREERR